MNVAHPQVVSRLRVAVLIAACCLSSCDSDDGVGPRPAGEILFRQSLCGSCHGSSGQGTWTGPPLVNLGEHWSEETLSEFIRDPAQVVENDQRLSELSRKFPTPMAPQKTLSEAQRLEIAAWLLAR